MTTMKSSTLRRFVAGVLISVAFVSVCGSASSSDRNLEERIRDHEANAGYYFDGQGVCKEAHGINVFGFPFFYATEYSGCSKAASRGRKVLDLRK